MVGRVAVASERMRRERIFVEHPALAEIDDWPDRLLGVELERDRDAIRVAVDEDLERQDALVEDLSSCDAEHPREVALLERELGRVVHLVNQVCHCRIGVESRTLELCSEYRLGEVSHEDTRVVAKAADHRRQACDPVLAKARGSIGDVAGEEQTGNRDALPERRERGQATLAHRRHTEVREILQRRVESGCRYDVVGIEQKRLGSGGVECVDDVSVAATLDALDRRVQDVTPRCAAHVLVVGRQVPGPKR